MRKFALFLLLACFAYAQNTDQDPLRSSVSFNLGGQASLVSCEFEYLLPDKDDLNHWSLTAGVGTAVIDFAFPVGVVYSYGREKRLIAGLHIIPILSFTESFVPTDSPWMLIAGISPRFGYKKIKNKGDHSTFFQIYYSPTIFFLNVIHGAALGWGIYF